MSTDVMASSSGTQEFPEMFDFSAAQFSNSAFDSDVFANTTREQESSALGENAHNNSDWVSFGAKREGESSAEFFAGMEEANATLASDKRVSKGGKKDPSMGPPKLRRCATETPPSSRSRAKPGADLEIQKRSSRGARSVSPKRQPSRTSSSAAKTARAVPSRRSPPRRTASASGIERSCPRRSTSADGKDLTDLSKLRTAAASRPKKGGAASVASAPPATRRLPGRSVSAKTGRGERSLSPRRVASSRKDSGEHASDPVALNLLEEDEDDEDTKLAKKPRQKSTSTAKRASSPGEPAKRSPVGRVRSQGDKGKHPGEAGKRASSPILLAKPQLSERNKSGGERRKKRAEGAKKRASSAVEPPRDTSPESKRASAPPSSLSTSKKEKRSLFPEFGHEDSDGDSLLCDSEPDLVGENEETADIQETDDSPSGLPSETSKDDSNEVDESVAKPAKGDNNETVEGSDVPVKAKRRVKKTSSTSSTLRTEHGKSRKSDARSSRDGADGPSRGVQRSRSMPKTSSRGELSRSPSRKLNKGTRDKSPTRAPTSMREAMSRELTKSAASSRDSQTAPHRQLSRSSASSRDVGKLPTRELKRGAVSSREVGRSPSRGLAGRASSNRDMMQTKQSKSPVRRTLSDKPGRPRRGMGPRAASSRSPARFASPQRDANDDDQMKDGSGGSNDSALKDGSDRQKRSRVKADGAPLDRNTARGRIEGRVSRRQRVKNTGVGTQDAPQEEEAPKQPQPRGPAIRRTLSGHRGRNNNRGNIQQRQLLSGLEATDHQKDELLDNDGDDDDEEGEKDEQLESSSWHKPTNGFSNEEVGDLFASPTWHSSAPTPADPTDTPRAKAKLSAMTSAFAGTAKKAADIFGLGGSVHGGSGSASSATNQSKGGRSFRTSVFGGKGKNIQGPTMLTLGGDDLDSSSEEFA